MTPLSQRMRWSGPPLNLDSWVEGAEIQAGRLGVILAALENFSTAASAYGSCLCEFAAGVELLPEWGGDDGGGPDPDPLPPWLPEWACEGRTTVLYAPSSGWAQRVLPNGNPVANQYWHQAVLIGGELVTSGVRFEAVTIDIDGASGNQPSMSAAALFIDNVNYTIPQTACMRADGTYANGQRLFFQRIPRAGLETGNINDLDYNIPSFAYNLPNPGPDPGLMGSPGSRLLRAGYAYVLSCQMDSGQLPDFDVYWGF